jgi:hypothetical protein
MGGAGSIYGQFTIKGPNGYETIAERSGTVASVTDTAGSTWSLAVKSADGTTGTFTVDSSTSVDGGESGIGSVKEGDTVRVTGVVANGTTTATQVTDTTVLQANGSTWQPKAPAPPQGSGTTNGSDTPSAGNTASGGLPGGTPPV